MRRIVSILLSLIPLMIFNACHEVNSSTTVSVSVSWTEGYSTETDMFDAADLVVLARLNKCEPEIRSDLVFTRDYFVIERIFKGDVSIGEEICVLQTGGEYEGKITSELAEIPLMSENDVYLLYLRLTEPNEKYGQYYVIKGGYQGAALYKDDKLVPLSEQNNGMVDEMNIRMK